MTTTEPDATTEAVASPITVPGSRYPTGWFQVGWSDDIAVGAVKLVHYFGRDIVLRAHYHSCWLRPQDAGIRFAAVRRWRG